MEPLDALQHALCFLEHYVEDGPSAGLKRRIKHWLPKLLEAEAKGLEEIGA